MTKTNKMTGISLKSHSLGEFDRIITFFTREHGLVRAVAKGIKKGNSRWSGRLDTLFCSQLTLAKGRNLDVILHADTLYAFPRLRLDLERLTHGLYLLELILVFSAEDDPHSNDLFDLLIATLQALEEFTPVSLLILWFELRLLYQLGYTPQLEACLYCNLVYDSASPGVRHFDTIGGGYVCTSCSSQARQPVKLPQLCIELWQQLMWRSLGDLVGMSPAAPTVTVAQNVLRNYIVQTAEQGLKSLTTLKAIQTAAS